MEFKYTSNSVDVNDVLYNAQLISNAFSKTMEDNNCLLMLSIGLHQEIDNTVKDLEDLVNNVSDTNDLLDKEEDTDSGEDILDTINDIISDLKDKCFQCDLKIPDLDFDMDLNAVMATLKAQTDLFKSIFKVDKIDLCQPAFALQSSCVPDIIRLITLLLTAFVSIMTLKKLSNISVSAFIKGVLSTLLSKITQSLKITVNIGSTNISCLVNTLQEIALAIPTQQNIAKKLSEQERIALGFSDQDGNDLNTDFLRSDMLNKLNDTINTNAVNINTIDNELNNIESQINEGFTLINNVIDLSLDELNNYIQSLLGFQTYFECESKRSGMDVEDAIKMINNLIQVINMLSSLVLSLVKKDLREQACKTPSAINNLSEEDISDLLIKDIISDNNQSIVEIIDSSDSALEVIIYDKPLATTLPKLDLLDCSIDDFVSSHTLPRIIEVAKKQLQEEQDRTSIDAPSTTYTFKKPSVEQTDTINNIVDLIYTKPTPPNEDTTEEVINNVVNPIGLKGLSPLLEETIRNNKTQSKLACKSIDDVLSILNDIKK